MISSAKPGKSPNSHEPTALWSFQISIKKSGFFAVDKRTAVPQLVGAFKCGNGFHPLGRPYQQFSWDIIFSNPLDVPHQTARFNPKRKHNNWQIREEIEEIIIDFTFFRHRRRFTTPVEQSTAAAMGPRGNSQRPLQKWLASRPKRWDPSWRCGSISGGLNGEIRYKWRFWHGNVWLQEGHPVTHPISWENDENPWGIDKYWHFGHKKKTYTPKRRCILEWDLLVNLS